MKRYRNYSVVALTVLLFTFALSTPVFAGFKTGSGPSSKAGSSPYGVTAQENASGAKLNGILQMSFTNFSCKEDWQNESGVCGGSFNAADAKVTLRLVTTSSGKVNLMKTFYVDLYQVPIYSIGRLQEFVICNLKPLILNTFFGGDCAAETQCDWNKDVVACTGDCSVNCGQEIYIKSFTNYSEANISTASSGSLYSGFSFIADIVLAVD